MKYYLIKSETRDGEFEYHNSDTYAGEEKDIPEFIQKWRGFDNSYQEVRVKSYQEIPKAHWDILRKYSI